MIERAFLEAMISYLATPQRLSPAPKLVGVAEPGGATELPAIVLSLSDLVRPSSGLGERSILMNGALAWTIRIDLANPVLPTDPSFNLVSVDRKTLVLHHGGLVRADGSTGAARVEDIQVTVDGQAQTLVAEAPGNGQFQADLVFGTLVFGTELSTAGTVEIRYFVGQWEQRVLRLKGDLHAEVLAADVAAVKSLSDSVTDAVAQAPAHVAGLSAVSITQLGIVARTAQDAVAARQRLSRFHFEFELEINTPDASGGIIREVPVTAILG